MSDEEVGRKAPKAPDGFVRGGTPTAKSERLYHERFADGEQRRAESDLQHELAAGQQEVDDPLTGNKVRFPARPGSAGPGGAVQYTTKFTENPDVPQAYLCLKIVDRMGTWDGELCLADVLQGTNPDNPFDVAIIIACPQCMSEGQKHLQDCQMRVLHSNTPFDLQEGMGPQQIEWPNPTGLTEVYHSAGVVRESAPFRCHDCGTRYRIDNNTLRPD